MQSEMPKGLDATEATPAAKPGRRKANVRAPRRPDGSLLIEPGSPPDIMCRVALDLFADQNYSTVTVKDIADAAGVNPSLLYYYFDNKEDLFMKTISMVVEEAFAQFETITRNVDGAEDLISAWIELHIRHFVQFQKVAKMSLDYASTHNRNPMVERAIRMLYEKESDVLGRAIKTGIREGRFADVNPAETALFISTFLDGALFRNVMFPTFNYARAIKSMRKIILAHLHNGPQNLSVPEG